MKTPQPILIPYGNSPFGKHWLGVIRYRVFFHREDGLTLKPVPRLAIPLRVVSLALVNAYELTWGEVH
jgi:hypothetical protein